MKLIELINASQAVSMCSGHVVNIRSDGVIEIDTGDQISVPCKVRLHSEVGVLAKGDEVLVLLPKDENAHGVVLDRVGPATLLPEERTLEASKVLRLKCGKAIIQMTADGDILIKGRDLETHAKRRNRLKGGTVAIN
jgi:hypothetical protein